MDMLRYLIIVVLLLVMATVGPGQLLPQCVLFATNVLPLYTTQAWIASLVIFCILMKQESGVIAKMTAQRTGKEDPVQLDSSPTLLQHHTFSLRMVSGRYSQIPGFHGRLSNARLFLRPLYPYLNRCRSEAHGKFFLPRDAIRKSSSLRM